MERIEIAESGWREFGTQESLRLIADELLWRLADSGYVEISLRPGRRVRIAARTYVGRALIAGTSLEIVEKVPGEVEALMAWATHESFKVERMPTEPTPPGRLLALLAEQFLRAVRAYASRGRQGIYVDRREVSSLVGGRLRAVPTLNLRARGLRHLVAFDRATFSFNTPLNRVVLRAIREVEALSRIVPIPGSTLAMARSLAMVFEDCLDAAFVSTSREDHISTAIELQAKPMTQHRDMLDLAAALLEHLSFERVAHLEGALPRAWFLDVGTLFETAVVAVLAATVRPDLQVVRGSTFRRLMFDRVPRRYRADPDIVVTSVERGHLLVGDVKHKRWTGDADESDIYQLLAHTATFGAKNCFLVYAGTDYAVRPLGTNPLGGLTTLFSANVLDLDGSLRGLADELGVSALPV